MEKKDMKIMLVAGEVSGDLHASLLARSLRVLMPGIKLFGMGGFRMKEVGVDVKFDVIKYANIGIWENAKNYFITMRRIFTEVKELVKKEMPDCIVLVDYQGFNIELAKFAKKIKIPVVYFVPPQYWAWRISKAGSIGKLVDKIIAIFPQEEEAYREAGADVVYEGNPLVDIVKVFYKREDICNMFILDSDKPIIGLLPGSRFSEVKNLMPVMLRSAKKIREKIPNAQFVIPVAADHLKDDIEKAVLKSGLDVKIISGRSHEVMAVSDVLIICSGLATLEAAIIGTPMVVIYKVSPVTELAARVLLKIPNVSPPNILRGKEIVPELLQGNANPKNISEKVLEIIEDPLKAQEMRAELKIAVEKLGPPDSTTRAAKVVLEVANK